MRRRKTGIMLGISCLAALLLAGYYGFKIYKGYQVPVSYTGRIMGIAVVEELDFIRDREQKTSGQNPGVLFEKTLLPYSSDGTLYLAQDMAVEEWVGELTTNSGDSFLCTLPDRYWEDKAESIRTNHRFPIFLVEEDGYYELSLAVSGMPVMVIETQREEQQDLGDYEEDPDRFIFGEDVICYGQMRLFDPGVGAGRYEIVETQAKYHIRGASSVAYRKKSYSLGLLDAAGEKLNTSLLGMRSDNSWKLKAMMVDDTRIRERVCCQLWEKFADANREINESGPRMEYVELVKDQDYIGIYGLIEPVDAKKLQLDGNDVLYKVMDWTAPDDEDIQDSIDHRWRVSNYIRIRYPDVITDYEAAWSPMRDYLDTFYFGQESDRPAKDKVYLSNALDGLLFNMTVSGKDNFYKNLYFAADVRADGSYTMRQIPWDLDLTFGQTWREGFKDDETVVYEEATIPFFREVQPELILPSLQERWSSYRADFLDTERILVLMRENRDYLVNTGAAERESGRWPTRPVNTDLEKIEDFQRRRMQWLDEYFAGY